MLAPLVVDLWIVLITCTLLLLICWACDTVGHPIEAGGSGRRSRSSSLTLTQADPLSDLRRRDFRGCAVRGRRSPGPGGRQAS